MASIAGAGLDVGVVIIMGFASLFAVCTILTSPILNHVFYIYSSLLLILIVD